jgi:hypothetical protein
MLSFKNMVKRTAAFLFILLANIILLAHTVIPHHHVNRLPSVVPIHGHQFDNCTSEPGEYHPENHDHHQGSDFYHCLLNQHFLNRSNSQRIDINDLDVASSFPILLIALSDNNQVWNSVKKPIRFVPIHPLRNNYTDYVNLCSGLRAPPVV